jgi:hypothetical protein
MNVTRNGAILAGLVLIMVAGAIQPAYSSVTPLLTLEETSSTSLTATLANLTPTPITLTVINGGPGIWRLQLPTPYVAGFAETDWLEPEDSSRGNFVFPDVVGSNLIDVYSDFICPNGCANANADETSVTLSYGLGTFGSSGVAYVDLAVVFDDDGEVATVPEPSTLSLVVVVALVSVIGFRRKLGSLMGAAART